jgi:rubrerythrin
MTEKQAVRTVGEIFELAIQTEEEAASIYASLSKRFSNVDGMPAFWHGLCQDELEHAETLLSIYKSLSEKTLQMPAQARVCENMDAVQLLLKMDPFDQLQTLDDAYELAHDLEFSEINAIFKFLTTEFISGKSRADLILDQIDHHQRKLMDFDKNFGDKNWRGQFEIQPE